MAGRLSALEEEVKKLKEEIAQGNEIVLNEIVFDKLDYRAQCSSLEAKLKELSDEVKRGEEDKNEIKVILSIDLEATRKEVVVKADELAALWLRVSQIEEA